MKERELFESKFGKPHHWIVFDEVKSKCVCEQNPIDHHLLIYQARWEAWQASANREGYKLASVEMSWEKADDIASTEWDKNKNLFRSTHKGLTAIQIEKYRLQWCKNKANQIMIDYKKMVGVVE